MLTADYSDECANVYPLSSAAPLHIPEEQVQQHDQTQSEFSLGRRDKSVASTASSSSISPCDSFSTSTPHKDVQAPYQIFLDSETRICNKKSKTTSSCLLAPSIDRFIQKTTESEKKQLDLQFARPFYACNIPFNVAENKEMKKLILML